MMFTDGDKVLVTGATGLVGSHVVESLHGEGVAIRALVRPRSDHGWLTVRGIECIAGELQEGADLREAVKGVTHVVHCAAKVGDWGPAREYRRVNVGGLEAMLNACRSETLELKRFVHISSLGVYPARDHYGTDESTPTSRSGIDGYTLSKIEAEELLLSRVREDGLPVVILRPGFIYGPRDRTILPRLLERLRAEKFAYLGSGRQLLNNTFVGNLVDAVSLALQAADVVGHVFNITDGRLVTRQEFIETICRETGLEVPTRHVPLPVARVLASILETFYRLTGQTQAPLLSQARIKFLGLNLDFSIDKARLLLGYQPKVDFQAAMHATLAKKH